MSRLILKEINKNINARCVNLLFSAYGTITDIKIFKSRNGTSRNFCFIGFSETESAKKAIQNLNKAFIENKKITVEEAIPKLYKKNLKTNEMNIYEEKNKTYLLKDIPILSNSNENAFETGILFIRNIPMSCKLYELETLFRNFGYLEFIKMSNKKEKKKYSKYAYIKFGLPECATTAAVYLDGKIFQGRILHIINRYQLLKNIHKYTSFSSFNSFKQIKNNTDFKKFFNHKSWFSLFIPENKIVKNILSDFGNTRDLILNYKHLKINIQYLYFY